MTHRYTDDAVLRLHDMQRKIEAAKWDYIPPDRRVFMRWDEIKTEYIHSDCRRLFGIPSFYSPKYINTGNTPSPSAQLFTAIGEHLHGGRVYELLAPGVEVLMQELAIEEIRDAELETN